jgi:hypothetical protein
MSEQNTKICPECFGGCTEHSEKDLYRYKGGVYFYNSHFWRCVNGHEFQMGDQMQKSLKQCDAIKKIVDKEQSDGAGLAGNPKP